MNGWDEDWLPHEVDCECVNGLSFGQLEEAHKEIFQNRVSLPKNKKLVVILNNFKKITIGINTRGISIFRGWNCFCLCSLYEYRDLIDITISPYYKTRLAVIDNNIGDHCISLEVVPVGHKPTCVHSEVKSLFDLAYSKLFLQYPNQAQFHKLVTNHHIPQFLAELKPHTHVIHVFLQPLNLLPVHLPKQVIPQSTCYTPIDCVDSVWI